MIGKMIAVGVGFVAGSALKPETRKKIGDAVDAVIADCKGVTRREADKLRHFWCEKVEPILDERANKPPQNGGTRPPPPAASA